MRLYWEVARQTARRMTRYRGATFAGVVTNTVFGFILAYVLIGVFHTRPAIGGFTSRDAVTFTFVAQALAMVVGVFGSIEMAERVRTGEVMVDLCRPLDFQGWWAAAAYGKSAFYLVFRGIPPFLIGAAVLGVRWPGAGYWPAFLVSVTIAVGVGFAWGFIVQLSAFWIIDVRGPNQLAWLVAQFLSGMYVPLVLFPKWLEPVARFGPFASMIALPGEVFLGKHTGFDLLGVYLTQLGWLMAFIALGRLEWSRAVRKVVVHGG